MKENQEAFFKYAKKFKKSKSNIKLLKKNETIATDPEDIANLLQKQFTSVFSDPRASQKKILEDAGYVNHEFTTFDFDPTDIMTALDEINSSASCGDSHIPATVLKNCKLNLCYPIFLLRKDSFIKGEIPSSYKEQIITPICKKGSKAMAANYRPISLTSHQSI